MNNRRKLLVALGAGAITVPFGSFAQQKSRVWRVGFLSPAGLPDSLESHIFGAFLRGMRELDYVEGKNLAMEWRFADGKNERLASLAAELVQIKVDAIVASGTQATRAAQKATTTIPIVVSVGDAVGMGLVKSLARPGGNITGISNLGQEIGSKRLEMLLSMVPKLTRVAVLVNPDNQPVELLNRIQAAAQKTGVMVLPVAARTAQGIENAFSMMIREKTGAVIVAQDVFFVQQVSQIAQLAAKHRLPSIAGPREHVEAGGLMSYGASISDIYRRLSTYVDKIFKGAKPADLPVEQPVIFELIINGKTAKALGLKIPQSLLIMTDKVIE